MLKIKTWRDPYYAGFSPTTPKEIELQPGLTVLVGCNGAGKSTLLRNIKEATTANKIPAHLWDNLHDGGSNSISELFSGFGGHNGEDMSTGISLWSASEGEAIRINIGRQSGLYRKFLSTGEFDDKRNRLAKIFRNTDEESLVTDNRRVFLFDATDSGLSVDAVIEVKNLFQLILEDAEKLGVEVYIIIAANEYELARGEQCFDVNRGIYLTFANYEEYRSFILMSRARKEKRLVKQEQWRKKKHDKELEDWHRFIERIIPKMEALIKKYGHKPQYKDGWKDYHAYENYQREIHLFIHNTDFITKEECENGYKEKLDYLMESD